MANIRGILKYEKRRDLESLISVISNTKEKEDVRLAALTSLGRLSDKGISSPNSIGTLNQLLSEGRV